VKPPGARATPPVIARKWHSASLCVGGVVFFPDPYYPVNALTGIAIGTGKSGHPPKTGLSGVGLGRGSSRVGGCARGCTRVRVNECNGDFTTATHFGGPLGKGRRRLGCFLVADYPVGIWFCLFPPHRSLPSTRTLVSEEEPAPQPVI
jgi:hypothetical protein